MSFTGAVKSIGPSTVSSFVELIAETIACLVVEVGRAFEDIGRPLEQDFDDDGLAPLATGERLVLVGKFAAGHPGQESR